MTTQRQMLWLVTGASQGFGRALTLEALRRGDEVIAVVRESAAVEDIRAEHPASCTIVEADLISAGDVEVVTELLGKRPIDVLVNNAGRAICGAAESLTMTQLREQLELNFFAPAALTRAALPGMHARWEGCSGSWPRPTACRKVTLGAQRRSSPTWCDRRTFRCGCRSERRR